MPCAPSHEPTRDELNIRTHARPHPLDQARDAATAPEEGGETHRLLHSMGDSASPPEVGGGKAKDETWNSELPPPGDQGHSTLSNADARTCTPHTPINVPAEQQSAGKTIFGHLST